MDTAKLRSDFLDEVKQAVCKDRTQSHGQPEDNFRNIAWLWTGWLRGRYHLDVDLDAIDVGYMSILLKVARAQSNPVFRDHALDTAGYAACIAGIIASEAIPEGELTGAAEQGPYNKLTSKQVADLLNAGPAFDPSYGPGGTVYGTYKAPEAADPEPAFVPTHRRADSGEEVSATIEAGDRVQYRYKNGFEFRTDLADFERNFDPIKAPEPAFIPTHYLNRNGDSVQVLSRDDRGVTYRTQAGKEWTILPADFDRCFTPKEKWDAPKSAPDWVPTHRRNFKQLGYPVRVLERTKDIVRFEHEDHAVFTEPVERFDSAFVPIP